MEAAKEVGQCDGADGQQFRVDGNRTTTRLPFPFHILRFAPHDHQRAGHVNNSRMSTPKFGFSTLGLAALMFLTLLVMPASAKAATTASSTTSSHVFPGPTTGNGVKGAIAH